MKLKLFYATNRRHQGKDRWHPEGYGKDFSRDGMENLPFGQATVEADDYNGTRSLHRRREQSGSHDNVWVMTGAVLIANPLSHRERVRERGEGRESCRRQLPIPMTTLQPSNRDNVDLPCKSTYRIITRVTFPLFTSPGIVTEQAH